MSALKTPVKHDINFGITSSTVILRLVSTDKEVVP